MRLGLSYDLKDAAAVPGHDDEFEEYDSPETREIITSALQYAGHRVVPLGGGAEFLDNIRRQPVDLVFNIAEGRGNYRSREAQVPAVLEMLGIPYSGSDPACLAVCLDKTLAKTVVAAAGVATPRWYQVTPDADPADLSDLSLPVFVKPAYEGSSKGVLETSLVPDGVQVAGVIAEMQRRYRQPVLVEEFIDGDEITVGIIGNRNPEILAPMRVLPRRTDEPFVYSLEVKRDYINRVDYECPARLPEGIIEAIRDSALSAYRALGCRDFARLDYRIGVDGTPYFIEANPLPGLGNYSDLVILSGKLGWSHRSLILAVLAAALGRYQTCVAV